MSGLAVGLVGVAVSGPVCRALGSEDPGCIVIDEIAGPAARLRRVPLFGSTRPGARRGWAWIGVVRALPLLRRREARPDPRGSQDLPGGWGVVVDDVLAGVLAGGVVLAAIGWVAARAGWI